MSTEASIYKHILIPTDGSPLSELAIRRGIRLAKSIGAKVTAITVFAPFHTIAVEPMMVTDTPEQSFVYPDFTQELVQRRSATG